jgi:hypothetical protein
MTDLELAQIVDEYASLKAQIEEQTKKFEALRKTLLSTGKEKIEGMNCYAVVSLSEQSRVDAKKVREMLSENELAAVLSTSLVERISIKPLV